MILILCNSFRDAQNAFYIFMDFLNETEPFSIKKIYEHSYCVETDQDLRYLFIDQRMEHLFDHMYPDVIYEEEFFFDIENYYHA